MRYPATCSEPDCERKFTVPFEPDPNRPLYCRDHQMSDPAEAYSLSETDGYSGPPDRDQLNRMTKPARDAYWNGFNEGKRQAREDRARRTQLDIAWASNRAGGRMTTGRDGKPIGMRYD